MAKKSRKIRQPKTGGAAPDGFISVEYDITTEAIPDRRYQRLPEIVKDAVERLHFDAQKKPLKAIPELLKLIEKYPDLPILYNYLSVAYSATGQNEKAKATISENIKRNPNYLFARLNYAEICLHRREYEKIEAIFDHKLELKLLYPHRSQFHVSEVVGFMSVMGRYYLATGRRDSAEIYYGILKQIAPDSLATRQLKRKLYPNLIDRLLQRLVRA